MNDKMNTGIVYNLTVNEPIGRELRTFREYPTIDTIYVNNTSAVFRLPSICAIHNTKDGYVKVSRKKKLSGYILQCCCCYVCIVGIGKEVEIESDNDN